MIRLALLALLLSACDETSPFYPCPVDLIVAAPGAALNVDSLGAAHHPDSLAILSDSLVVIAGDCS